MSESTAAAADCQAFLDAITARPNDPLPHAIYADWLDEQGHAGEAVAEREQAETICRRLAAERHAVFARTFFVRSGLVGGNQWSVTDLQAGITRRRGRCGPRSRKYAEQLQAALQRRADRKWSLATKGQRIPTPRQAVAAVAEIRDALESAQGRCSARTMTAQEIIALARRADTDGATGDDGGKVTCGSYGYSWTTTTARCRREAGGIVSATISRSGRRTVSLPAKTWQSVTLDSTVLKGGGVVGVRRAHGWDCYDADGGLVAVAISVTDAAVAQRWSRWEHGRTVAEAAAEVERKRDILRAEREEAERRQAVAAAEAKQQDRLDRAARLLARIGANTVVGYDDARAVGACQAGLAAFASRIGVEIDARLPLTEVARHEPAWAVKIARRLVAARVSA